MVTQKAIEKRIFNQKVYDLHVQEFMLGQTVPYLDKDKVTIDVGAACGMYSKFFAEYSDAVLAFEPAPQVYKQLQKLHTLTADKGNVWVFQAAVTDFEGSATLFLDDERLSNNSLYKNEHNDTEVIVETTTLDAIVESVEEHDGKVGFIKIDTEGAEFNVLRGGIKSIEKHRPTCMVEVYDEFAQSEVRHLFKFFFDRDYKCFFNWRGLGLHSVPHIMRGVEIACDPDMLPRHDGDFLFVSN